MRSGLNKTVALLLLALTGCQSSGGGGGGTAPASPGAPATTGDKVTVCTAQAAAKFGVAGANLSLSNDYPTAEGDAIDGAATLPDGFKRFRCDFRRDGSFVSVTDITGQA